MEEGGGGREKEKGIGGDVLRRQGVWSDRGAMLFGRLLGWPRGRGG